MATENREWKYCSECGEALPLGVLEGHCPRCLAQVGLKRDGVEEEANGEARAHGDGIADLKHGFSRYELRQELGAGGMGKVFLAQDRQLDRKVALKPLSPELAGDVNYRNRFLREAKATSGLNHPNLCVIHEVGEAERGQLYIAMEYVAGEPLTSKLQEGPIEVRRLAEIGRQVADALAAAHAKGIIHRDIKPANICLNEQRQAKVLDFGLAKRLAQGLLEEPGGVTPTASGKVIGTPHYMSPEQVLGRAIDGRSDLFSVGAVLYELATGQCAFGGPSFGEVANKIVHCQPEAIARFNYDLPAELERIIRKCLEKEPDRRYQSARELVADLDNFCRDFESAAPPDGRKRGPIEPTLVAAREATLADSLSGIEQATEGEQGARSLKDSDIYISYSPIDDLPLPEKREGWVSQFHRNLEVRTAQLFGEPVKIWRRSARGEQDSQILEALPQVKAMVSVVSPPFIKTEGCRREVVAFWQHAQASGNLFVENRARVLNAVKAPVAPSELPRDLAQLFSCSPGVEFFERDPETGRAREFDEAFGERARERFYEKIYDLAYEISQVLKDYQSDIGSGAGSASREQRKTIFLAFTTSDLQPERDRLKRELIEQGYAVVPNQPLPWKVNDLQKTVARMLEQCDLAIHLIGDRYGLVPEDSEQSVVALLNALAAERSAQAGLERLIWIPREIQPRDQRQQAFLRQIVEDPELQHGAEVIQDTLENLKEVLQDKWRHASHPAFSEDIQAPASKGPPRVYLIATPEDETAIETLEDALYEMGVEVSLPAFDLKSPELERLHFKNLQDCDGVLIYYGAGSKWWVDIKLRDLVKAAAYRDGRAIPVRAVYLAPPFDRRKERFRSLSAEVVRQQSEAFDPSPLTAFAEQVKASRR